MDRSDAEGERLEVQIEATGRGRRMVARLPDGTVLASGRHFSHLRENITRAVRASYGREMKVVLMVGPARKRAALDAGAQPQAAALPPEDTAPVRV
jgi:hypothetical protein